jgi:predicted amidohydrolase YtcJ
MKSHKFTPSQSIIFSLILSAVFFITPVKAQEILKADTIITNGNIVTMDNTDILSSNPGTIAEAMAIRDGRILALGTNEEMRQFAKVDTRFIGVKGKTIIPGLIDTHIHPESSLSRLESAKAIRDTYELAAGLHTAVLNHQNPAVTLTNLAQLLRDHPPQPGEWIHIRLIPDETTDGLDLAALTDAIYNNLITMEDMTRTIPNNPASLGIGDGPGAVLQPGVVIRVTVAADGRSNATVVAKPGPGEFHNIAGTDNPFAQQIFEQTAAYDKAEELHAHRNCGFVGSTIHHGRHCSHNVIVMNKLAFDATLEKWPGFVTAANESMSLTERAGDRGLLGGVFRNTWTRGVMFPTRVPTDIYEGWMKEVMQLYANAGLTMIASSIEEGRTMTAFYNLLRKNRRLPIRFGYGYEMLRDASLYPSQPQIVQMIGAHVGSPDTNNWFWPMGITDGGAGDARRVACFGDDLPGPDELKDRELCMTPDAYRIQQTLVPAIAAGWRVFSIHAFGTEQFRLHAEWIEQARVRGGMSMEDIRNLRLAFAHGGAVGKIPDVMNTMRDYNFYVPIRPSDVVESLVQVKRYGPEGLEFLAPTKTLLEAGIKVVGEGGNDLTPHIYFRNIEMFVTRNIKHPEDIDGTGEIVMPEEAVSRATALRLYTHRAAEWLFAENLAGTLEPGKFADFIVIDNDYFSVPASDVGDNTVLMTIVGDEIVYQDPQWQTDEM